MHTCHCKWHCMLVTQSCPTLCNPMGCSPSCSSIHGDSPGKNTGVGCHFLLQGTFPIQGSNLSFLHCKRILYPLSHWFFPTVLNFTSLCSYLYYVLPVLSLICFLKILRLLIQNFLVSKVRHKSLFLCTSLVASYKFCNVFLLSTNWKFS